MLTQIICFNSATIELLALQNRGVDWVTLIKGQLFQLKQYEIMLRHDYKQCPTEIITL